MIQYSVFILFISFKNLARILEGAPQQRDTTLGMSIRGTLTTAIGLYPLPPVSSSPAIVTLLALGRGAVMGADQEG